ncbi:HsdM family class I SAM-dependent methyltransferase [Fusobacterium ulcerans]|uniref:HsdM family class I SAM-dependent methyltransferase n=1 Tax=Fusobacterium ulcerans TaxID=861 RepID=UPI00241EAADD|nr:N-6 DNA methylase [Fusobacterium ulcerans]
MKESEHNFCLGILYDTERLYIFKKINEKYIRFNDDYNSKGEASKASDMNLHLTDSYQSLPKLSEIINWNSFIKPSYSDRSIEDLDIISSIHSIQINNAMSNILRTMDKQGKVNQIGYSILLQILALKIFDEKRNEKNKNEKLKFYINPEETNYTSLADKSLRSFINRILKIRNDAEGTYFKILGNNLFNSQDESHIKVLIEVVKQFQHYSFVLSTKTDLYQLVFYKFASQFSKDQNAQFITPLPVIEFLVNIVNPRSQETIIDPTVGIADFLSVSYVNSNSKLDDNNIFGLDIDEDMVKLATLNMLLNGDGNATIKAKPGYGSILTKFDIEGNLLDLETEINKNGNWDERFDGKKIKKFDVVLTNPPFGDDRAFIPKDKKDIEIISCYELWNKYNAKKIDLGVIFLENSYHILKENGRMGIVLSNSIASIDAHKIAREWLMEKMRIVAIFDLPSNVFAETGVNTTIIVAYKPKKEKLLELKKANYEVFFRNIEKVGYEVKTKKRVKVFEPLYKFNYKTYEIEINEDGSPVLNEDFTQTIKDFKDWCLTQEEEIQKLFIKEI